MDKRKGVGGRPNKYDTHIKPFIKQIAEWKKNGATDEQVCQQLGVSKSTFYEAKNKYPEFLEALKKSRENFISDLRGELARLSFKHTLETVKVYSKTDENGQTITYREKISKEIDGDIAAIHLLLKNLDPDWRNDDKATMDLKREQLEIAKQKADENNW